MPALDLDRQPVELGRLGHADQAQADPEAHVREVRECHVRGHRARRSQHPVRATDAVLQRRALLLEQHVPDAALEVDDVRDERLEVVDQLLLGATQRDLVADLVQVPRRATPLAVHAAHGESRALRRGEDLLQLAAHQPEAGKVQHHRGAQPGADVRRTAREVTQAARVRDRQALLERAVDLVHALPGEVEVEARRETPAGAGGPPR